MCQWFAIVVLALLALAVVFMLMVTRVVVVNVNEIREVIVPIIVEFGHERWWGHIMRIGDQAW